VGLKKAYTNKFVVNIMKKMAKFSILFLLLTISCAQQIETIPGYAITSTIDFTKYTEGGFLITPFTYLGDYESICIVDVTIMPETKLVKYNTSNKPKEDSYFKSDNNLVLAKKWESEKLNLEKSIDYLYKRAVNMGANAIVDFKIETIRENHTHFVPPIEVVGIRLSGFAIKRLGAFK